MTRPKPTSELILATEKGDPLLAWWRYGLGMTVAFTSDAKSRWAAEWLTWPGYSKFWAQVVRHAMRKSEAKGVFVQVDQQGRQGDGHARRRRTDGKFLNDAAAELTVIEPQRRRAEAGDDADRPRPVRRRVPGRQAGTYHVSDDPAGEGPAGDATDPAGWSSTTTTSCASGRPTRQLLESVARASGGHVPAGAGSGVRPGRADGVAAGAAVAVPADGRGR